MNMTICMNRINVNYLMDVTIFAIKINYLCAPAAWWKKNGVPDSPRSIRGPSVRHYGIDACAGALGGQAKVMRATNLAAAWLAER
jgi:hypothetical protein